MPGFDGQDRFEVLLRRFGREQRAGHATAVVADLIAQDTLTTKAELGDTFAIAEEILAPFAGSGMSAAVKVATT